MIDGHRHTFEHYDARLDAWVCYCGCYADRFGVVFTSGGQRIASLLYEKKVDPGVRSGRELLSC